MNLRYEALSAASRNPGAPLDELVGMLSVSGKPARQAVLDAKKGGLLSLMRDDVTGQPGYILTDAGKKRLADGPDKLNGSNMVKGVQPEHLKKAAEKAQPKAQPVAAAPEHDDLDATDSMPPADPALLASANRMLGGRLNRIAEALRSAGITSLNSIEDGEDLTPHVEWLIARYFDAIHEIGKQQALIDILKRNFESKERECEALRKSLESAQSGDGRPIAGYTTGDLNEIFATLDEAREDAEEAVVSSELSLDVYELRLAGTAKRAAEWVPE